MKMTRDEKMILLGYGSIAIAYAILFFIKIKSIKSGKH